jgi:hemerythrin-like metal-binding protein
MLDKYKLGIDVIDEQHQKLFDLIDKMCVEDEEDCSPKLMLEIISELKDYSLYHFKTEEEYFNKLNFKESKYHVNLHEIFIETIDFYYNNPKKLNRIKIYSFLQSWIRHHILIEDKKYTLPKYIEVTK